MVALHEGIKVGTRPAQTWFTGNGFASEDSKPSADHQSVYGYVLKCSLPKRLHIFRTSGNSTRPKHFSGGISSCRRRLKIRVPGSHSASEGSSRSASEVPPSGITPVHPKVTRTGTSTFLRVLVARRGCSFSTHPAGQAIRTLRWAQVALDHAGKGREDHLGSHRPIARLPHRKAERLLQYHPRYSPLKAVRESVMRLVDNGLIQGRIPEVRAGVE